MRENHLRFSRCYSLRPAAVRGERRIGAPFTSTYGLRSAIADQSARAPGSSGSSHTRAQSQLIVTTRVPSGLNALVTTPRCSSAGASGLPVVASQIRAVLSSLTVMTRVPSKLNAALVIVPGCSNCGDNGRPVIASQTRAVLSSLIVMTRAPSGLNAALVTDCSCSMGGDSGLPLISLMHAVLFALAVTMRVPSRLNSMLFAPLRSRNGGATSRPVVASQTRSVLSLVTVTTRALHVTTKEQHVETNEPVTIEDARGIIRGKGLTYDNKAKTLKLKSEVSGTFQPQDLPK